jgi:protein-L-isoaspartate(D-aspartate) O-methyltransferase
MSDDPYASARRAMVEEQLAGRGIRDPRVLEAFARVPRHEFVPEDLRDRAYGDHPLPIGQGQTISQPYIVAFMTEALELRGGERVLEVGTGSGYQAAILKEMGADLYTVELLPEIAEVAKARLERLGWRDAHFRVGDGSRGWPEEAPFDRILVAAGAPSMPVALPQQLREGGSMVIPVGGEEEQDLLLVRRRGGRVDWRKLCGCIFVKLRGAEGW